MSENIQEKFNETYKLMVDGGFNDVFRSSETLGKEVQISVKKLKKYCRDNDIDFDDFLKYAQKRKAKENAKN